MELKLPEQIDVIDITMRDGLQNEEHYVPLEAKLYLADRLIKAGFKRLEVGSISHVAYVPQFKDVDELLLKLPKDVDVEYTVLALTPKAIERVGGLLDRGAKIDRVLTGQIATSEAYAMKNRHPVRRHHRHHDRLAHCPGGVGGIPDPCHSHPIRLPGIGVGRSQLSGGHLVRLSGLDHHPAGPALGRPGGLHAPGQHPPSADRDREQVFSAQEAMTP